MRTVGLACALLSVLAAETAASPEKPSSETATEIFKPDDLFRFEGVRRVAFSPDGRWLAYEVTRPANVGATQRISYNYPQTRSDVWLVRVGGGRPTNLTKGAGDDAGYWNPVWSPDSSRLALLRIKDGRVRLFVAEPASGKLRQLTDLGVKEDVQTERPLVAWAARDQVVCHAWADGIEQSVIASETRLGERIAGQWARARDGRTVTAMVLDSGRPIHLSGHSVHRGRLVLINVTTAAVRLLAEGEFRGIALSPDKRRLAFFVRPGVLSGPHADRPVTVPYLLKILSHGSRLHWVDLTVPSATVQVTSLAEPSAVDRSKPDWIYTPTPMWSPDGEELVLRTNVIPEGAESLPNAEDFQCLSLARGKVRIVRHEGLEVLDCAWCSGHDLLAYARPKQASGKATVRADWWYVRAKGDWINLTEKMKAVPRTWLGQEPSAVVGSAGGALWRVPLQRPADVQNLTSALDAGPVSVLASSMARGGTSDSVWSAVVAAGKPGDALYILTSDPRGKSVNVRRLQRPMPQATLAVVHASGHVVTFRADDDGGAFLWLKYSTSRPQENAVVELFAANQWLRRIRRGELKPITYFVPGHGEQKGWILLPPDLKPGARPPLVVWVYGGSMQGSRPPNAALLHSRYPYNFQLLAAHGYAVLFPSMPPTDEPCRDFPCQVLPAVEKIAELGWADTNRTAVMGMSFGGYTTLCLVGQTNRFRAAIAMATGSTNLAASYGATMPASRYGDLNHPQLQVCGLFCYFEGGQVRMGQSPFRAPDKYRRNSPATYLDKVKTPTLLIHGDCDPWSTQASEEFYAGLYRQGRRAQLVRYFGESHGIEGRANLNDAWKRIYQWLDEFLASDK